MWRGYAYAWITLGLFVFSLAGHWLFGWFVYERKEAKLDALLRQMRPDGKQVIAEIDAPKSTRSIPAGRPPWT